MADKLAKNALKIHPMLRKNPGRTTHFISFPLYTVKSQAKLENLIQTLRDELFHTSVLPRRTFRLPTSFHLVLHRFRVETIPAVERAVELLHRFDLRQLLECQPLQEHAKSPTSSSLSTAASGQLDSNHGQQMKALKLTLRGLRTSHNKDLAKTPALYGILDDPSNRLPSFFRKVEEHFDQGGVGYPPSHSTSLARLGLETSSILDTCYSGRYQWELTKKGLRKSVRERPTFDARDSIKKYQDTV